MKTRLVLGVGLIGITLWVFLRDPTRDPAVQSITHRLPHPSASDPISRPPPRSQPIARSYHNANRDLRAELESIRAETHPGMRSEGLSRLSTTFGGVDIEAALSQLIWQDADDRVIQEFSQSLIQRWAESDPAAAAAWATNLPAGKFQKQMIGGVAIAWANVALPEAREWVNHLPAECGRREATLSVAYEAARTHPIEALDLAAHLPADIERDNLIVHSVNQWAATEPTAALKWTAEIKDEALRQKLLACITVVWADKDAHTAAILASTVIPPGRLQQDAAVGIVQRWAQYDPIAAENWVRQFPDDDLRETAMANLKQIESNLEPEPQSQR
jgi:hypothetical protein